MNHISQAYEKSVVHFHGSRPESVDLLLRTLWAYAVFYSFWEASCAFRRTKSCRISPSEKPLADRCAAVEAAASVSPPARIRWIWPTVNSNHSQNEP
jgi:hypothetical protein